MLHYLFDDIIYRFRAFFQTQEKGNQRFLYDICFGLKPAKFDPNIEEDSLILNEEDEVSEMYFILEGSICIRYYLMTKEQNNK